MIPACNEAARIGACLTALRPQAEAADCALVVVVNGTRDDTARIARGYLADAPPGTGCVLDLGSEPLAGGVGRARAIGFDFARHRYLPSVLLSTDADCVPAPDWLARNLAALEGVDVVYGQIDPDAAELAALAPLQRLGAIEGRYMETAVRLAARLDPRMHDPVPGHRTASGASLAFRSDVLAHIGGFPALPLSEDRAFARAVEYHDLRARHSAEVRVQASCRIEGRAAGGMADTLRARCAASDPDCDDWLEPAEVFALRHSLRGALRQAWPDPAELSRVLGPSRFAPFALQIGATGTFGAFWAGIEARLPDLSPRRLSHAQALQELPRLEEMLKQAERVREPAPPARSVA